MLKCGCCGRYTAKETGIGEGYCWYCAEGYKIERARRKAAGADETDEKR